MGARVWACREVLVYKGAARGKFGSNGMVLSPSHPRPFLPALTKLIDMLLVSVNICSDLSALTGRNKGNELSF